VSEYIHICVCDVLCDVCGMCVCVYDVCDVCVYVCMLSIHIILQLR